MKSPIVNNERIKANAWLAGFLALFPGFYAIFTNTTDSFTIYMILGSAFLIISQVEWRKTFWRFFLLGFIAGLLHFARADGILWLFAALIIGLVYVLRKRYSGLCFYNWLLLFAIGIGYVLVMSPWYIRNVNLFGSLFPPGGSRTLWLLNYDQIFSYPATGLNFTNWWNAGLAFHLNVWLGAFWTNFKTIVGVQGLVFLLPLMILGIWHLRKEARIKTGMVMWALILGAMTFAFPFPGSRGGYLHSSAAIQPVLWAVTGFGLDVLIHAGVRWRNWAFADARKVFGIGVIFICMLVTGLLFYVRQIGPDTNHPLNRQSWDNYREVERELNILGIEPQQAVLINNPPMYYVTNRRPAFVIPDGDIDTLVLVAKRYHLNWMVLEKDHPKGLNELYQQPDQHNRYLDYMGNEGDNEFFFIRN